MTAREPQVSIAITVLLVAIVILGGIDLALDAGMRGVSHFVLEIALLVLCLMSAVYLGVGWYRARKHAMSVRERLRERQVERDQWKEKAERLLKGLGEAVDEQLREWNLTGAERETAFFLLKGYSHKEIAALTGRSERTVRQHGVAVYRKSGLSGRAELAAFFLEDLLAPMAGESRPASGPAETAPPATGP